jgi:hypothetical protein
LNEDKHRENSLAKAIRFGWTFLSVALFATGVGCGSNSSTVTVEQACADVALAQCSRRLACSSGALTGTAVNPSGVYILTTYGVMNTCVERVKLSCEDNLTAPGSNNTPAQLEKCAAEYSTYSCIDLFDNGANPPPDCAPPGQLANGATCAVVGQCASRFCSGTKNSTCGICADDPADGTPCETSPCGPGQECATESTGDLLCRDRLPSGNATCTGDLPCQAFSACIGDSSTDPTKAGVCTTNATSIGAACGGTNPACDGTIGLTCLGPAGNKTCQPIAYVQAGAACGTLADGSRASCTISDCFTATGPAATTDTNATCVARAVDGAPCNTQIGPLCLSPARCVLTGSGTTSGTCVVPTASLCN